MATPHIFLRELFLFGLKQARACLFPVLFFTILFVSRQIPLYGLPRYDFIFVAAITVQLALIIMRIETIQEMLVLCAFHFIGIVLEIFKTHPAINSWSYPEAGYCKVFNVPLYSGFMYASVASYMCQAWRLLRLELHDYPAYALTLPLGGAIYANFFSHHFMYDLRWCLALAVLIVFWRTSVRYVPDQTERRMPLVLSFVLIGFFIWVAENISTYLGAWSYPEQASKWSLVSAGKISSWFLLVIISFIIVADLKHFQRERKAV